MANSSGPKNFKTVNKLCCCLSLKTGMSIVGWIEFILATVLVVLGITAIIVYYVDLIFDLNIGMEPDFKLITLNILFNVLNAYVFFLLIQGIKHEIDSKILPYLILNGIYIIFFFFAAVVTLNVFMFIGLVIYIYIYICAFGLYSIFSNKSIEYDAV